MRRSLLILVALAGLPAQGAGGYQITRSEIPAGAGNAQSSAFRERSSAGVVVAGTATSGAYQLRHGFWGGGASPTTASPGEAAIPLAFHLHPNIPNPFNPRTSIHYDLPAEGRVVMSLYNVQGRLVRRLVDEVRPAGRHMAIWDGTDQGGRQAASGVYVLRIAAGEDRARRAITLLR
jgi:hypothetical protein